MFWCNWKGITLNIYEAYSKFSVELRSQIMFFSMGHAGWLCCYMSFVLVYFKWMHYFNILKIPYEGVIVIIEEPKILYVFRLWPCLDVYNLISKTLNLFLDPKPNSRKITYLTFLFHNILDMLSMFFCVEK